MLRLKPYCFAFLFLLIVIITKAQQGILKITETSAPGAFPIATSKNSCSFYYDSTDAKVVTIAAKAFINDVKVITGKTIIPHTDNKLTGNYTIVAGTIGHSAVIDRLIANKKLDVSAINGQWERFSISVIDNPPGSKLLVIAGSDRRGTAFGIFHLSRLMGVSPFYWWADITPDKKENIYVSGNYISSPPSVKYRGIFINDEDWGLQPWAAQNLDKDVKDIGPNTYAKVFELLLRLKANYIWPAMHPCTKAFYYYPGNPKVADDYAIVVGGSHCEPMLRNNVFEWSEHYEKEYGQKPGEWRYDLNKPQIYNYWNDRVKQAVNYESMYTVGMRGIHDGSMPGPKDPDAKLKLLSDVIVDQRSILENNFHKSATTVPQVFIPYKEVLSLYRRGLQVPDDVTIIWPDDNHGYIRQLPNEK
ncbi:MAG TPA: glycosyl hydrolase 115 family protein, partial [Chitinophagaceae bacterium]|nr:glycosyl hydrolase 115 family protein [Chitinophagaceae bacterium]